MKAVGRSDLCLKLEIIKKTIGFLLIVCTMFISVQALAWSTAVFAIISTFINMAPNKKLVDYSFKEQVADIFPNFLLSVIMGFIVWSLSYLTMLPGICVLIIQITTGLIFCLGVSYIFKFESLVILLTFIKNRKLTRA